MTIDEFIAKLAETKGGWRIIEEEDGKIRSTCLTCPIVSIARYHENALWGAAAHSLGLTQEDAIEIIKASDNISGLDTSLRERLIQATGAKYEN